MIRDCVANEDAFTLQEAIEKGLWTDNDAFIKKWPIFQSLMAKEYHVLDGSKFGGDFLVYQSNDIY